MFNNFQNQPSAEYHLNADTDVFFLNEIKRKILKSKSILSKNNFLENHANPGILWRMAFRTNCTHFIFMNS